VSAVFATANDAEILEKAGIESFKDPRFQKYSDRLKKLRAIKDYQYVVHVLERGMSYEEVTEIFARVGAMRSKITAATGGAHTGNDMAYGLGIQTNFTKESNTILKSLFLKTQILETFKVKIFLKL